MCKVFSTPFKEIGELISCTCGEVYFIIYVDVMRALLNHNGAGGVVRSDGHGTVLNAGSGNDLDDLLGNVVEGGNPSPGLELQLFLKNLEIHF